MNRLPRKQKKETKGAYFRLLVACAMHSREKELGLPSGTLRPYRRHWTRYMSRWCRREGMKIVISNERTGESHDLWIRGAP